MCTTTTTVTTQSFFYGCRNVEHNIVYKVHRSQEGICTTTTSSFVISYFADFLLFLIITPFYYLPSSQILSFSLGFSRVALSLSHSFIPFSLLANMNKIALLLCNLALYNVMLYNAGCSWVHSSDFKQRNIGPEVHGLHGRKLYSFISIFFLSLKKLISKQEMH